MGFGLGLGFGLGFGLGRSTSSPWCEVHESSGESTPGLRLNLTNLPPCSFIIGSLPTVTVDGAGGVTSAGVSSWLE